MTDVACGDTNVPLSQCDRFPGSASFLPRNEDWARSASVVAFKPDRALRTSSFGNRDLLQPILQMFLSWVSPVPLKVEQTQLDTGFGVSKLVAEVGKPL